MALLIFIFYPSICVIKKCIAYFIIFKEYLFIHLSVPGLSCGMQDSPSLLQCVGPLFATCEFLVAACGI